MHVIFADPVKMAIPKLPSNIILMRYEDGFVETHSEYNIYSEVDILTASGGALGMFLGWSVYQKLLWCCKN